MEPSQKKFIIISVAVSLITIGCALLVKAGGIDLNLQPIFFHLFARYDMPGAILLILILLTGIFFAIGIDNVKTEIILNAVGNNPFRVSCIAFLVLGLAAVFVYQKFPLTADEYMPCFQARIFAEGRLWGQYPPELVPWLLLPDYFTTFSTETGRVVSDYWPGFALLLAPFMKLGLPWLLNPLISAGTISLLWYYTKTVLPKTHAPAWVTLLTLASPVFALNGISFYAMSAHLFFNLLYATLLLELTPLRLFLAGLVGSFALVLHVPIPHLLFALPWIIWIGLNQNGFKKMGILFAGYLPLSFLLGFGWVYLKLIIAAGASSAKPDTIVHSGSAANSGIGMIAFMVEKAADIAGGLFRPPTAELLWIRLLGLLKVFVWAIPGLPILAVWGIQHTRKNPHLRLWGWSTIFTLAGYLFVPFSQGHGWGFRYFHSCWLALPLLATAFLLSNETSKASWNRLILAVAIISIFFFNGFRFYQANQFISGHLSQAPLLEADKQYVCFIKTYYGYFTYDFVRNDPFLRNTTLYLQSLGLKDDREMMAKLFPEAKEISLSASVNIWDISKKKRSWPKAIGIK